MNRRQIPQYALAFRRTSRRHNEARGLAFPRKGARGYNSITDYVRPQLVSLIRWINSDTLLRTDEELIQEVTRELGFKYPGRRIRDAIKMAIRDARR